MISKKPMFTNSYVMDLHVKQATTLAENSIIYMQLDIFN